MKVRAYTKRSGFTLVEILLVVAIIATLAALLLGAINRVGDVGRRTVCGAEISQLETAVAKFKQDFGFAPPSYAVIPLVVPDTSVNTPEARTYRLLTKMFRAYGKDPMTGAELAVGTSLATQSDGFKPSPTGTTVTQLQGIQSLAFFLGGPQLTGFKPNLPIAPQASASSVKGPYYNFDIKRFTDKENPGDTTSFRDPWGTKYAYFSAGSGKDYGSFFKKADVPDLTQVMEIPNREPGRYLAAFRVITDPKMLSGFKPTPWAAPANVQIISAGPDTVFGSNIGYEADDSGNIIAAGNAWLPGVGEYSDLSTYTADVPFPPRQQMGLSSSISAFMRNYPAALIGQPNGFGADDISNFNGGLPLGSASK